MKALHIVVMFCAKVWIGQSEVKADMSHFKIEEFYECKETTVQTLHFFIKPKNFNAGLQLVDINMSTPISIGNDVKCKVLFEVNADVTIMHSWVYLFQMEGDFCKMLDRYAGELWYDIERALGVMPRSCPILRGSYHANNYLMDYEKLKLQTFPFGKIRVTISGIHKTRPEIRGCFVALISNTA